jgi:hypothetical protein
MEIRFGFFVEPRKQAVVVISGSYTLFATSSAALRLMPQLRDTLSHSDILFPVLFSF